MKEIYAQSEAAKRGRETLDIENRTLRRGGAPGDVVPLGKRKRPNTQPDPNPRATLRLRKGLRPNGPLRFTIAG